MPTFRARPLGNVDPVPVNLLLPDALFGPIFLLHSLIWAAYAVAAAQRLGADLYYTRDPAIAFWAARRGLPLCYEAHSAPRRAQRLLVRSLARAPSLRGVVALTGYIRERFVGLGFPPERSGESMEHLSRGMQQKVALARALLTSPVLLLLDEPTTGLDPRSKLEVQEFVRDLRERHDSTIVLCTHDMAEAEALADRVGILDRGELLFLEPVADAKARFAVETLEAAFFAATGRTIDDEDPDEREVFA